MNAEPKQLKTPLLFMIFNRPDTTRRVFAEIRKARPMRLFVAADGPRPGKPEDAERCRQARAIIEEIDWPCEVKKLYRDKNLGCQLAPAGAVTWFFENVEEGIILEDDCIPDPSFFPFCEELLAKYRDDPRVLQISASNFLYEDAQFARKESYYFSVITYLWGWASWRRAWKLYDLEMKKWPENRDRRTLRRVLNDPAVYEYWESLWNTYYDGVRDSWDRPWAFATMLAGGLSVTPMVNLVSNIGFGAEATHTKNTRSEQSNMAIAGIQFPLTHPAEVKADARVDAYAFMRGFGIDATRRQRIVGPIRRMFPKTFRRMKRMLGDKRRMS